MKGMLRSLVAVAVFAAVLGSLTPASVAQSPEYTITPIDLFDSLALTIPQTNTVTTNISAAVNLDVRKYRNADFRFAVYWDASSVSNPIQATLQYELSADGTNYVAASNVCAAFTNASGRTGNGKDLFQLTPYPVLMRYIRVVARWSMGNTNSLPTTGSVVRAKLLIR